MTSCLVLTTSAPDAPALSADLESVGIHVLGAVQRSNLVQEAVRLAPDLVICHDPSPDAALFEGTALLLATSPRPVVLFTTDPDADKMTRALECGVHVYVVHGYAPQRLRPLIHLAQARFAHEQRLREQLADVSSRFEERKLVDRAKGILMRARQVSEDEAFRVLRAASMQSNQRVGQVSQQVIAAAAFAEAVNRAGQLRMLSQRIVKLHTLQALAAGASPPQLEESCARVDANLALLAKSLSKATYGDLLDAVAAPWNALKAALATPARLAEVDALAERMLVQADRLVNTLESTGAGTRLHVINVSGRQRMLSQRVAKQALLAALLRGQAAAAASAEADKARGEFEQALAYLDGVPLSSREIRESLDQAQRVWAEMTGALAKVRSADGQRALGDSSEALLALFDQLTERYERSMQMLMG
ncbi:MAG TPA: type IV pili methyl-accepting chemotaxis transducer N-terminal domain-containing protein [Albitalea sp.]|uniref:type IV pili methyl-accepting chemotaxis transducer N-terminal domain-containing protein n=1 Tax=Piscinibacter sp. TaxID=1903157 RepID=UPI002ED47F60